MVADSTVVSTTFEHLSSDLAGRSHPLAGRDALVRPRVQDPLTPCDFRLRKHADYQRVYREGRKQFSSSMSYFYALRSAEIATAAGPRVGLTAGKVLGNAVERNRIKRRMRDIVRRRVAVLSANVDVVLHPKKTVLAADFAKLESEVVRIFSIIETAIDRAAVAKQPLSKVEP